MVATIILNGAFCTFRCRTHRIVTVAFFIHSYSLISARLTALALLLLLHRACLVAVDVLLLILRIVCAVGHRCFHLSSFYASRAPGGRRCLKLLTFFASCAPPSRWCLLLTFFCIVRVTEPPIPLLYLLLRVTRLRAVDAFNILSFRVARAIVPSMLINIPSFRIASSWTVMLILYHYYLWYHCLLYSCSRQMQRCFRTWTRRRDPILCGQCCLWPGSHYTTARELSHSSDMLRWFSKNAHQLRC